MLRGPFDQGVDRGTVMSAEAEVAVPMPWDRPVLYLGTSVRDDHLVLDPLAALIQPAPWLTQSAAGAQGGGELPAQPATALDVIGLVDGIVADPHLLIVGEVQPEEMRDLLGSPVLLIAELAGHVVVQSRTGHQLGGFRPEVTTIGRRGHPRRDGDMHDGNNAWMILGHHDSLGVVMREEHATFERGATRQN